MAKKKTIHPDTRVDTPISLLQTLYKEEGKITDGQFNVAVKKFKENMQSAFFEGGKQGFNASKGKDFITFDDWFKSNFLL